MHPEVNAGCPAGGQAVTPACGAAGFGEPRGNRAGRWRVLSERGTDNLVQQAVRRYPNAGTARTVMNDVRRAVKACARFEVRSRGTGEVLGVEHVTTVARRFAGRRVAGRANRLQA